jgi:hypothetical protein
MVNHRFISIVTYTAAIIQPQLYTTRLLSLYYPNIVTTHRFTHSVSDDLSPLSSDLIPPIIHCPDKFIIEPYTFERKFSKSDTNKSGGPHTIPNWILRDS